MDDKFKYILKIIQSVGILKSLFENYGLEQDLIKEPKILSQLMRERVG